MSELLTLLNRSGALRPGHTVFRNGAHADGWIEKGDVFKDSRLLNTVAQVQATHIAQNFGEATLLVGAPACGGTLTSFIGLHLGLPVAYVLTENPLHWHRMHVPGQPQRSIYIDDLICTGTGTRAVTHFLHSQGHEVLGVSAWLSRATLEMPTLTLDAHPFHTFRAPDCPLCHEGQPVIWNGIRE
ncbi:orotate phosphoribosyltransferase [Deinococcus sp.]|uniref:orotate phosphoribosyltransferase n=1 Tax=Deinococcus sp. TaxID=47478 RepID=UPI0025C373B8|nr:orotate phosphoribosyltransferase [Deinococcus sp.]